ncbi:hypothetical protein C4D60_Mb10t06060 [Musa balbisiana]|uniref:Uncharacterized protein n=1 Tax=Musa balbisiana TaxID=52838 RepID=A0A4S8IVV7_MUSBA|nr:hypothetical protein C4D60_Mb10t06060 [Musa balbisiana]
MPQFFQTPDDPMTELVLFPHHHRLHSWVAKLKMINRGHLTTIARLSPCLKLQQSEPSIDAGVSRNQRERIRTARLGQTCRARDRVEDDCSPPPSRHSRGAITVAILPLAEASPFPFIEPSPSRLLPAAHAGTFRESVRRKNEGHRSDFLCFFYFV